MQLESVETATTLQRRLHAEHKRRQERFKATARDYERGKTIPIIQVEPVEVPVVVNANEANLAENWKTPEAEAERIAARIKVLVAELKELGQKQSFLCEQQISKNYYPVEKIQKVVATYFKLSRSDLLSARRTRHIVRPRQIAMLLCRKLTLRSLPQIGRMFGGRDHTTVLSAVRKIESLRESDPVIREKVEYLWSLFPQPDADIECVVASVRTESSQEATCKTTPT